MERQTDSRQSNGNVGHNYSDTTQIIDPIKNILSAVNGKEYSKEVHLKGKIHSYWSVT